MKKPRRYPLRFSCFMLSRLNHRLNFHYSKTAKLPRKVRIAVQTSWFKYRVLNLIIRVTFHNSHNIYTCTCTTNTYIKKNGTGLIPGKMILYSSFHHGRTRARPEPATRAATAAGQILFDARQRFFDRRCCRLPDSVRRRQIHCRLFSSFYK